MTIATRITSLTAVLAVLGLTVTPSSAATMSSNPVPPAVDGEDIAHSGTPNGTDKWWPGSATAFGNPGMTIGQTFTTGSGAVLLKAVTFQIRDASLPSKDYTIRVGEVSGTNFSEVHSETATQGVATATDDYWTWTFDTPVLLSSSTEYGVDVGLNSSTSGWQSGIPYAHFLTSGTYTGGTRFRSGTAGNGVGDASMAAMSGDRVFHLDIDQPAGPNFEFVAGNPPDDTADALIPPELVATFNQDLVAGTGNITIRNLTDSVDTAIPVGDSRVSLSGNLLMIETAGLVDWSKSYAVRIDPGAVESDSGESFAGINDDATWNFTTGSGDPLLDAIAQLKDHINGAVTLSAAQIDAHKVTIDAERNRFDESAATIAALFDLVTTYDNEIGPLWIARGQFDRNNQVNDLDWTIYHVMQYIMDEVYNPDTIAAHEALLNGYKFGSSAHFPGAVDPPADPRNTHSVSINGSFPDTFGRDTQGWTLPARKPTGAYLPPGTIATVTVPPSLVNQGYLVRIGAHSWNLSHRRWVRRLDRATILYPLDATTIEVASPYGGGIYIEVPFLADAGVVNVDITGAVRSPYFSAKSFHATTNAEWIATERNHPAPWADFQSDKFMMQVPTSWIDNMPDPVSIMADWDAAMDAMNDLMGFPQLRGKETMYPQVDVILRSSVHAPGYPSVNTTYNPTGNYNGNHGSHLVQGPRTGWSTEFHEQGHAYFFPKFGGETESNVNLLYVPVLHRKFGVSLDDAFRRSTSYGNFNNVTTDTLDNTAVLWMTSFNFAPSQQPMASWEKAYQPQGHAKFVDVARLFGWEGLGAYWYSMNLDQENGDPVPGSNDAKLIRLCESVGEDLRPLFHFWGIHPGASLQAAIDTAGLTPSPEIYDLLAHYKSLVPADNAAYQAWSLYWYGRAPSIGGYGVEREHTRQWDTTSYWQDNGWQYAGTDPAQADGEVYLEASGDRIEARVQELIDLYFPGGRPVTTVTDYDTWADLYPGADLTDPGADLDGDGVTNDGERLFGTDPTSALSRIPIAVPLDAAGTFSYTRRDPALSGLSYTVWVSTDLENWDEDTGALQSPGTPVNDVESVAVALSAALLTEPQCFIQVRVE